MDSSDLDNTISAAPRFLPWQQTFLVSYGASHAPDTVKTVYDLGIVGIAVHMLVVVGDDIEVEGEENGTAKNSAEGTVGILEIVGDRLDTKKDFAGIGVGRALVAWDETVGASPLTESSNRLSIPN